VDFGEIGVWQSGEEFGEQISMSGQGGRRTGTAIGIHPKASPIGDICPNGPVLSRS
jgi:hypothetical protein